MKTPKLTTEEKYFNFLNYLYNRERGWASMKNVCMKHKISEAIRIILSELGMIRKKDGIWNYTGDKPNLVQAGIVLSEVNKYITSHDKILKNKATNKKEKVIQKSTRKANVKAFERYNSLLNHLYERERSYRSLNKILTKFKVGMPVGIVLKDNKIVEKKDGKYKWIGKRPDEQLVNKIISEVNDYSLGRYVKDKKGKKIAQLHLEKIEDKNFNKKKRPFNNGNDSFDSTTKSCYTIGKSQKGKTFTIDKDSMDYWVNNGGDAMRHYKARMADKEKNIIDLSSLKSKRQQLQEQIGKIDSFLEVAQDFLK